MRKFTTAFLTLLLVSTAAATTIKSEEVRVDLATSRVDVTLEVQELTSQRLSYLTNYPVSDMKASVNGTSIQCEVDPLQVGSEIRCDPPRDSNFTVELEYKARQLILSRQKTDIFQYTQNFYRPTKNFRLRVTLPKGAGLLDDRNITSSVISPSGATTGSNGRRIFVEWKQQPELGDTTTFQVAYQSFSSRISSLQVAVLAVTAGLIALGGYLGYRRLQMEDIENLYEDMERDEIEVVDLLRENDGSMLQKDVVDQLDYSKAKVSGVVSGLVEDEVVNKEKEGRSNRLNIAKNYRT